MNRLWPALLLCALPLTSNAAAISSTEQATKTVEALKEPLYTPFVERYVLDELRQLRTDMQAQRAELIEKVVDKELVVADKSMNYATNTITYFFYLILGVSSLLVLAGWTSIRDIKATIKNFSDQEVARLTAKYETRLQALEDELNRKSQHITQTQAEIERTNEIHSLWLRASQESNPKNKITLYDNILGLRPDDTEALTYKADAALSLNEAQWALSLCDQTLKIDPRNAHAFYQRACAHAWLQHDDEALADLATAISLSPAFAQDAQLEENFTRLQNNADFRKLTGAGD